MLRGSQFGLPYHHDLVKIYPRSEPVPDQNQKGQKGTILCPAPLGTRSS